MLKEHVSECENVFVGNFINYWEKSKTLNYTECKDEFKNFTTQPTKQCIVGEFEKKTFGSGSGYMDVCSVVADVAKCDNSKNKLFS
jgi:hypothetical protein